MKDLLRPVAYLERSDFNDNGDLSLASSSPILIMIQGSFCGACTTAKPVFQQFANEGHVTCMTIQIDGERESQRQIRDILDRIYPGLTHVPAYVLYVNTKTRIPLKVPISTIEHLKQFVQQHSR